MSLTPAFPNLAAGSLGARPLFLTSPPDGSNRIVVVEQNGRAFILPNDPQVASARTFLDIRDRVSRSNNEEGLLGLAFNPQYAQNGFFYVYYSAANPRRNVLSRFQVSTSDPNVVDPQSETMLLESPKPFGNHNGGMIAFGPDGYLYVGIGDGGGAGDPQGNGQKLSVILGKVLRIDVNHEESGRKYAIPPDNPFAGANAPPGVRPEIWAYGLRNPWRFSFDPQGRLWVGDVGQDRREEIDIVTRGGNYGWNTMEGTLCFNPTANCDQTGLSLPIFQYAHDQGCSITGGYVYRGSKMPSLRSAYIYSDACSNRLWALRYDGSKVPEQRQIGVGTGSIVSFGEDAAGELYILSFDGRVYTLR
ncbi:MAG: PQQ-dependent sugar dehydrogenase [Chloroflexi bacterium]|nr:PQQ-dependent sugar dehydrogenase [Chloroflexota bacterium]